MTILSFVLWTGFAHAQVLEDHFYAEAVSALLHGQSAQRFYSAHPLSCLGRNETCRSPKQVLLDAIVNLGDEKLALETLGPALRLFIHAEDIVDSIEAYLHYRTYFTEDLGWENHIQQRLRSEKLSTGQNRRLNLLAHHGERWPASEFWNSLKSNVSKNEPSYHRVMSTRFSPLYSVDQMAKDLLTENPEIHRYKNGEYVGGIRFIMFCPDSRLTPCLMFLRDGEGKLVRGEDGKFWHQPALGYSKHEKKFNERNGNTPSGVYQIDGVMPVADQQLDFGKFRRLILNFISPSQNEVNHGYLLPESSLASDWWHEAVIARDAGRGLFRIHGTGRPSEADKSYYPFVPTSGCVAQRENFYDGINYIDQRLLLDRAMLALGLEPIYENEPIIFGLLYVMNIGPEPVTYESLESRGILPAL